MLRTQPSQRQRPTCVRTAELGPSEQRSSELARNVNCLFQMTFGNSQLTYMTVTQNTCRTHVEL